MKKLSIVAALLFAFGTVTFAQDAAKTAPAKTDKKAAPASKKTTKSSSTTTTKKTDTKSTSTTK